MNKTNVLAYVLFNHRKRLICFCSGPRLCRKEYARIKKIPAGNGIKYWDSLRKNMEDNGWSIQMAEVELKYLYGTK